VPVLRRAAQLVRQGSMFWVCAQRGEAPRAAESVRKDAAEWYRGVFHGLLHRGILLPPSYFEVGFLSLAHTREHLERLAAAFGEVLEEAGAAGPGD
jgi:glutamate-1-semialdehyde 2,1-aminomutase